MDSLPAWLTLEAWNEYAQMRRRIKKPLTELSTRRLLARCYELHDKGHDANEALLVAADCHWLTVYPPKDMSIPKKETTATNDWLAEHQKAKQASQTPESHEARKRVMALVKPGIKRVA